MEHVLQPLISLRLLANIRSKNCRRICEFQISSSVWVLRSAYTVAPRRSMQHLDILPELASVTLLKTKEQKPLAGKNLLSFLLKDSFQYFGFQKLTMSPMRKISFMASLKGLSCERSSRPLLTWMNTDRKST